MADNIPYKLLSLTEDRPGWCSYALEGSNGYTITGGVAGTLDEARIKVKEQIARANGRRMVRQRWVYWGWAPESVTP